jgi:hypothetical protein
MSGMRCEYGEASMVEGEFLYILRLMLPRKVANEKRVHYALLSPATAATATSCATRSLMPKHGGDHRRA